LCCVVLCCVVLCCVVLCCVVLCCVVLCCVVLCCVRALLLTLDALLLSPQIMILRRGGHGQCALH